MRAGVTSLGFYGFLAASGLGLAYWAALPVNANDADKVAIVTFAPQDITSLTYTQQASSTETTELAVKAERSGEQFWIQFKKKPAAKPTADSTGETATAEEPEAPLEERFLANKEFDQVLATLNPLRAERDLGQVDVNQLEEYGLKDPAETFVVEGGGKTFKLFLGKKSYGSRNRFAMGEKDRRILLVDDATFENLQRANTRLYERQLVSFEADDIAAATIEAGGKSKKLAHTQRDQQGNLQWSDPADGDKAKPAYQSWMDKVSKLRLVSYATAEFAQELAALPIFLQVSFEKIGGANVSLKFVKKVGEKPEYWVMSSELGSYAQVAATRMEGIEKDAVGLFAD